MSAKMVRICLLPLLVFTLLLDGCYTGICHPISQPYATSYNKNIVITNMKTNIGTALDDSASTVSGNASSGITDGRPIFNLTAGEYDVQVEFPSVPDVGKSIEYRQYHENDLTWEDSFHVYRNNSVTSQDTALNKYAIITRVDYDLSQDVFPSYDAVDRYAFNFEFSWDDQRMTGKVYINEYVSKTTSCS